MRSHLRPYELIVRVGGDEFLCAHSDARIDAVRAWFAQIAEELVAAPSRVATTVGFAELAADDSATELVGRADASFRAAHRARPQ